MDSTAPGPRKIVGSYALTSANDFQQRDPQDWRLLGSNDGGRTWTTLDKRTGEVFSERHQRRVFTLTNTNAFNIYRFDIDRVCQPESANCVQLAEIELMGKSSDDSGPTPIYLDRITAQGDNPPLETVGRVFDGLIETKWLDRPSDKTTCASWIEWQYQEPSDVVITNISRLRELRVRAEAGYAVKFESVVVGKIAGTSSVELLDDSGFLEMDGPAELFQFTPGQRIWLEGWSTYQGGKAGIRGVLAQVRTPTAAATPAHFSPEQPLPEGANFLWAQVEGTIQFKQTSGGQVFLKLQSGARSMSVSMADLGVAKTLPENGRRVRMTGICQGGFNVKGVWVAASLRATSFEELPAQSEESADQPSAPVDHSQTAKPNAAGITRIAQIRQMSMEDWRRGATVTVRGVATSLMGAFLQDDSAGIQVVTRSTSAGKITELGGFVEVTGEIGVSEDLTPHIAADKVVFLGRGTLPPPKHIPWDQLANGRMDAQWVEMQGVVRATDGAHLLLNCEGRQVTASLGAAADAVVNRLVDASIRIQGVALAALDDLGRTRGVHLLIPSLKFLEIESEPPAPFSQPKLPIQSLLRVGDAGGGAHRVRVEGVLTLQDGQRLFLQDDTGAAMAIFKQQVALDSQFGSSRWSFWRTPATPNVGGEKFLPGDRVEVVGFQDAHGYSPVLTEVLARKTGGTGTVTAQEITTNSFTDWKLDSYLVKLTGVVVGEQVLGEYRVLELRSLGRTLQAFLPVGAKLKEPLQPGTTLQVTGVWQMDPESYEELGRRAGAVRILARSPADLVVLARPSWWTVRRAMTVAGALVLVLMVALIWITQLRRKVEERTVQLSAEIHRREQIEHQRVMEEERARIARDLHDDLGAALTQIRFLSAMESRDEAVPEGTRGRLRRVTEKSHQLVTSLDEIVWAINPANDSLPNLVNYLSHTAEELFAPTPIRCRLEVDKVLPAVPVSSEVRHHIYLTVREASNNIAKHSGATEVWLRFHWKESALEISIQDNGRGFSEAPEAPTGQGLRNMRRRVEKIGGQFFCESKAGAGTLFRLVLPLPSAAPQVSPV